MGRKTDTKYKVVERDVIPHGDEILLFSPVP